MKTVRLGVPPGLESLAFTDDVPEVAPGPGEIFVRIEASSLNRHDYAVAMGWLPAQPGRILLADVAGSVERVGSGVSEFAVGDRVISCFFPQWQDGEQRTEDFSTTPGDGVDGYARGHVTRPSSWFTRAPKHLTALEAATLPTAALTAWRALVVEGRLRAGESVLVLGTGGVSIFALQMAKRMGASVIVTSSSDEKLARARLLGADHVINYKKTPEWEKVVREVTDGRGVDHVLETAGAASVPQSIEACRIGGDVTIIGATTGISATVPMKTLMGRQQRLIGILVGSRQQQEDMVRALEVMELRPVVDRTFALAELRAAFEYEQGAGHLGKIGIQVR